ncbi:DUF4864 domain-containing protein [Microcoleus sp. FACHB-1515]|uniref:DUF4864 domain-containing protein n=1 Tax=Cyanophyceae TaxID=3028117 RepID=UPI0016827682|nr:DUF4864 domain-containing protein [Microcoleus sp. FACHB-1515]MBD2089920.1 DUF4864 domain-containing protein [Microcoleus sp. FACHB-1515]
MLSEIDRRAIRHVIGRQLEAFRRDDADEAFAFASPAIQAQFESPTRFMAMVRSSYAPVYRPRSILFQEIVAIEGYPAQKLALMDANGQLFTAFYLMEPQPNGRWRIQGCFLMPLEVMQADED